MSAGGGETLAVATGPEVRSVTADVRRPDRARRLRNRLLLSAAPLVAFILIAVIGPVLVPYDAVTTRTGERLKPPGVVLADGTVALLGTDQVGKDLLAQVLQGARI